MASIGCRSGQVLDHVAPEQLVRDLAEAEERECDREQPARERELTPQWHRPPALGQVRGAQPVQQGRDQDRQELDRRELRLEVSLQQSHRGSASTIERARPRPAIRKNLRKP
jgi:hypothetical protein